MSTDSASATDLSHSRSVQSIGRFAVFGRPIAHSLSPEIHLAVAEQPGLQIDYRRIECADRDFSPTVREFLLTGGSGLNVTTPFKQMAYRMCTERSPEAKMAQAVNSVRIAPSGAWEGHITDGLGLCRDLRENLAIELDAVRVLLLGAGATARVVAGSLMACHPVALTVFNRGSQRLAELLNHCRSFGLSGTEPLAYHDTDLRDYDLIINCASGGLGTESVALPDLPPQSTRCLAYDLTYGRGQTAFIRQAQTEWNCRVCDGIGLLVEQAAYSFVWWNGEPFPETRSVLRRVSERCSDFPRL